MGLKSHEFSELNVTLVPSMAAKEIRKAIFSGDLKPGDRLITKEIAEKMGVSQGSVREALKFLESENLVEITPNKGANVVSLTPEEVEDIYKLRNFIESSALRHFYSAGNGSKEIRTLKNLALKAKKAVSASNIEKAIEYDLEFHGRLCRYSKREVLNKIWADIANLIRLFLLFHMSVVPSKFIVDHVKMVDYLRDRAIDKAVQELQREELQSEEITIKFMNKH